MERSVNWRELYRTNDPALAHTVATCIEGMEFDVRVRDAIGCVIDGSDEEGGSANPHAPFKPPFAIDVRSEDWAGLRGVLDELIAEQVEFDSKLEVDRQRAARVAQLLILSAVTLLAAFAGASALKQCEVERP
jgi:hypothetical protein